MGQSYLKSIQDVCSKTNFSNCLRNYAETTCFTNSDEEPLFWLWWSREFPQEMQDLSWLLKGQRTVSLSPVDKAKDSLISTMLCFPVLSASRFLKSLSDLFSWNSEQTTL